MVLVLSRTYFPDGTNGKLEYEGKFICSTIELPWINNEKRVSCIPEGKYLLKKRYSRKFQWHIEVVAVKNRIQTNLATQYERLNAARQATLSLHSDILPNAKSAFDAANRGFSLGKFNFLDVLDAQRTLYQAKSQYINALLEAHQSIAEIERALGEVVDHQITKP